MLPYTSAYTYKTKNPLLSNYVTLFYRQGFLCKKKNSARKHLQVHLQCIFKIVKLEVSHLIQF
jgi:hypothetical protein